MCIWVTQYTERIFSCRLACWHCERVTFWAELGRRTTYILCKLPAYRGTREAPTLNPFVWTGCNSLLSASRESVHPSVHHICIVQILHMHTHISVKSLYTAVAFLQLHRKPPWCKNGEVFNTSPECCRHLSTLCEEMSRGKKKMNSVQHSNLKYRDNGLESITDLKPNRLKVFILERALLIFQPSEVSAQGNVSGNVLDWVIITPGTRTGSSNPPPALPTHTYSARWSPSEYPCSVSLSLFPLFLWRFCPSLLIFTPNLSLHPHTHTHTPQ